MPLPWVNSPCPPTLLTVTPVAPPLPVLVESTTSMSERLLVPPAFKVVLSSSLPPLDTKVPPPSVPAVVAPLINSTLPTVLLPAARSSVPLWVKLFTPSNWPCTAPPGVGVLATWPKGR
ncbi:hypothetical protein D3C84_649790 [compost metagenome]